MIGKLVVVKDNVNICVGEVVAVDASDNTIAIKISHMLYTDPTHKDCFNPAKYWTFKSNIIKKSSRPVKMKQQLSLEEQQPTTL